MKRYLVLLTLFLTLTVPSWAAGQDAPRYFKVTVLQSTDNHGRMMPYDWDEYAKPGEGPIPPTYPESKNMGGLARRSTMIKSIRQSSTNPVFLVDTGDWVATTGELWRRYKPQTVGDIACLNAMGYDVAEPGNHEFQWTWNVMDKAWKASKFPWICANLVDPKKNDALIFQPYLIKQAGPVKVAFLGLITPTAPLYNAAKELKVLDPIEVAKQRVPELLKQADVVIILSHMGVKLDMKVAEVPGIAAVIGGHSHRRLVEPALINNGVESATSLGKTPVVQAGWWGMDLGQLDLTFCKGTDGVYRLMSCKETLHPITSDIKSDPAIDAIIKPFDTKVN